MAASALGKVSITHASGNNGGTPFGLSGRRVADGVVGPITWTALGMKQSQTEGPRKPPPPADQPKPTGDWMGIAEGELGVHENSLPGQNNLRILEYHETTTLHATTDEVLLLLLLAAAAAAALVCFIR